MTIDYKPFPISQFRTGFDKSNIDLNTSPGYIIPKNLERCMKKDRIDCIDMKGKRFGKLIAIDKVRIKNRNGLFWECNCDCGNKTTAFGGHLRAGRRVSCGCAGKDNFEKTGLRRLYRMYQYKSKKRNKEFSLSVEQFGILIKRNCFYCNMEPLQVLEQVKSGDAHITYNGIDRKDSDLGYTFDNSVTCCKRCNFSKSNMKFEEWMLHIKKIISFQEAI